MITYNDLISFERLLFDRVTKLFIINNKKFTQHVPISYNTYGDDACEGIEVTFKDKYSNYREDMLEYISFNLLNMSQEDWNTYIQNLKDKRELEEQQAQEIKRLEMKQRNMELYEKLKKELEL